MLTISLGNSNPANWSMPIMGYLIKWQERHKKLHSFLSGESNRSPCSLQMPYTYKNKTVYYHGEDDGTIQDYKKIKKACLEKDKKLFEDDQFPADDSSISHSKKPELYYKWLRPAIFMKDAKFVVNGHSRFDINQGNLGNCWLLAGIVSLTTSPKLLSFVVPKKQSFQEDYAGIFHFRFWRQGRWIDVVIDDRLPTIMTSNGRTLAFAKSSSKNEFWSALLEKAYAKLFGSYEAIEKGDATSSMVDLSGGVPEVYYLDQKHKNLFEIIHKACRQNAWITCASLGRIDGGISLWSFGLVPSHAYNITAARKVKFENQVEKQELLRIRNPWGQETEWKGAYNDNSQEWQSLSKEEGESLDLEFKHDGEYWMHFRDFEKFFMRLEICHLSEDFFRDYPGEYGKYLVALHHGSWSITNGTARGCLDYKSTFHLNPQYRIIVHDHDTEQHDGHESKNESTLIVSLMQKNRRKMKSRVEQNHFIAFYVYHITNPETWAKGKLQNYFINSHLPLQAPVHRKRREVTQRFQVKPGTYAIIPTTYSAGEEAEFMLRILTEKPADCSCIE